MKMPAHIRVAIALLVTASSIAPTDADDWPQWFGPQRDGVWRETGIVDRLPDAPDYRWRVPIGAGYAGPAVANGRVFVTDRQLASNASNPEDPFQTGRIAGTERVICLDEKTGEQLWLHEYDCPYTVSYAAGPRATPTVDGDCVYTLGTEGNLLCLDAATGEVKWGRDFKEDFGAKTTTWGWASAPLIHGDHVISLVGGDGSLVVAFDKSTGEEAWRALSAEEPGYGAPMIFKFDEKEHLIIWHSDGIASLDPATGSSNWNHDWAIRYALTAPSPRQAGDRLFFTTFYNGSRMLDLSTGEPELLWKSAKVSEKDTDKLHSIISSPVISGGMIFGVCSYGQLRGLDLATGERIWEELEVVAGPKQERWGNAFIIPHEDRFFLFTEQGDLALADMSRDGYTELGRMHIIEADNNDARTRKVVWSHPAFANGHVIVRNSTEIVSVSLRK